MKVVHYIQLSLAALAAGAGAAVPFVGVAATPWLVGGAAVSLAVAKALGVQSEVAGDKAPKGLTSGSSS
jgi:hypothetical protein